MLDDILVISGQLHRPIFDDKYAADQAITKATLLHNKSKKLVVVFLPWHMPVWYENHLKTMLAALNQSVLIYHFNESIIADEPQSVISSFEFIALSIASDINELRALYNFTHIDLLGISLGNVALCITAEKLEHFNRVIMIVPGDSLASSLWAGWRTRRLRKKFERAGVTLERLQSEWAILAPSSHINAIRGHKIEIILAKRDRFIPYPLGRRLVSDFVAAHAKVVFVESPFGHAATILSYHPEPN